jgi:hypothetical protein
MASNDDHSSDTIPLDVYCITAHTIDPDKWYVGSPDSGYSVDNLAPPVPTLRIETVLDALGKRRRKHDKSLTGQMAQ